MLRLGAIVFVLLLAGAARAAEPPAAGSQGPAKVDRQLRVQMNYLLYLPENYSENERFPLLLFLHGAGERGDNLELVKVHGPPKLIAQGQKFPFIVVSPQCPADQWWEALELTTLLDDLVERYSVDEDRIYVTGLSMGGFGTWRLAAYTPDRFAAIAPICGGGERLWARQLTKLPVWTFHGDQDQAVPLERSQIMVDAVKQAGGNVKFTVYENTGHDSWTQTYENPELYKWLLEHRRPGK